jgi:hypothetical protein
MLANAARYFFKADSRKDNSGMDIEPTTESPYLIVRSLKNK